MEPELKHLILANHPDTGKYTLTRVFKNGESRLWSTFVTQRHAVRVAMNESKRWKIPVYNKMHKKEN